MASPSIGQAIHNFSIASTANLDINLKQFMGQNVIIYFYPKDNTPGCTTEGQDFSELHSQFEQLNCVILGVSRDSVRKHLNFKAKHNFPFELLADIEEKLCQQFDVIKLKKLYGKEYMGIERSTFLINTRGELIQEWRKVKVKGHVDEVLQALKKI